MGPIINSSSEEEISFKKASSQGGTIVFKPSILSQITFQPRTIDLNEGTEISIQRHDDGDKTDKTQSNLLFTCPVMSGTHAKLKYSQGKFYVLDNNSTNGSFLTRTNCEKFRLESGKSYILNTGDILQFGQPLVDALDGLKKPCLRAEINILENKSDTNCLDSKCNHILKQYECQECWKKLASEAAMQLHFKAHENKINVEKTEVHLSESKESMEASSQSDSSLDLDGCFKCKFCEDTFRNENNLLTHTELKHENLEKYHCKICSFETTLIICLENHVCDHENIKSDKQNQDSPMNQVDLQNVDCENSFYEDTTSEIVSLDLSSIDEYAIDSPPIESLDGQKSFLYASDELLDNLSTHSPSQIPEDKSNNLYSEWSESKRKNISPPPPPIFAKKSKPIPVDEPSFEKSGKFETHLRSHV